MNLNDLKNVKTLVMPYIKDGESVTGKVKKIQKNGVIIWKNTCTVSYTINTGTVSITIVGDDGVTYVNAETTSGTVEIPRLTTITCSAVVANEYDPIEDTTKTLEEGLPYSYSPTATLKTYTITLSSTYGYWKDSNNTTITSITNVPHWASVTKSGQRITVNGLNYNFIVNSDTAQYNYTFNSISIPSGTVTDNMTITGTATQSIRSYNLTFWNDSGASKIVTVYFRSGSGSWSSYNVRGDSSQSYSATYGTIVQVYFTYGDATSSTKSITLTSDQTVYGECSSTTVYEWTWHGDGYMVDWDYGESTSIYAYGSWKTFDCAAGWASTSEGRYLFNRSPNSDRVKIELSNGRVFIASIPSGMPISYDDSSSSWDGASLTVNDSPNSGTIGAELVDRGEEGREMKAYIGVYRSDSGDSHPISVEYGTFSYDYKRTDYSVWWN